MKIADELANQYVIGYMSKNKKHDGDVAQGRGPLDQARHQRAHAQRILRPGGQSVTPTGRVFIIGAGPGDPGLITARGVQLLADADVVVYDRAVETMLRWARPDAERIAAGAPAEREVAQDAISMLLAEKARDGHTVARLKWGDAFVFDSGAKEALFLHEQGVPFEVVPGIPAAIGATAYAGVPVTYPGAGDALVLLRGQEAETRLAARRRLERHREARRHARLLRGRRAWCRRSCRRSSTTARRSRRSAALIYRGTQPAQRTVTGNDRRAARARRRRTPAGEAAMLVVGEVTVLRDHLRWFDERPLFGRRIVVTRSREQARDLVDGLENLGAQAIEAPTFRIAPPEDPEAVDRAAASVDGYDWVVFESANAVARFFAALRRGPRDLRALGRVSICAIGASTAEWLARQRHQARRHRAGVPRREHRRGARRQGTAGRPARAHRPARSPAGRAGGRPGADAAPA